jgi:hypothetical protein
MRSSAGAPPDYRGVWVPVHPTDGSSPHHAPWARWLQTCHWHAHLCLPMAALQGRLARELASMGPDEWAALTHQQAHMGGVQVQEHPEGELCTWLRQADYQPPAAAPDAEWVVFYAVDRLQRIGAHAEDVRTWHRLPDSVGRFRCLAGVDAQGQDDGRRVLVAGAYVMWVQLRPIAWPRGMRPGLTLAEAMMHRPDLALSWLDRELSFGRFEGSRWVVERSTLPAREGRIQTCDMRRDADDASQAWLELDGHTERWRVLEWTDT